MAVAFYTEYDEGSPEASTQITERILQQSGPGGPAGMLYHAEGPLDGDGWWVIDVLESEAAAECFYSEVLTPILRDIGGLEGAQRRKLEVYFETSNLVRPA